MAPRVQSPSSINTYNQCPRKYFYRYIEKLPGKESPHLIIGKTVHSILEDFFQIKPENLNQASYAFELKIILFEFFRKHWGEAEKHFENIEHDQPVAFYKNDINNMLNTWHEFFLTKLKKEMHTQNLVESFQSLTPICEMSFRSPKYMIRGFIDAIHEGKHTTIIDYKTSKAAKMSEDYLLQLSIYALLYLEKYKKTPDYVGLHFVRHGKEIILPVQPMMVENAQTQCKLIQLKTRSVLKSTRFLFQEIQERQLIK